MVMSAMEKKHSLKVRGVIGKRNVYVVFLLYVGRSVGILIQANYHRLGGSNSTFILSIKGWKSKVKVLPCSVPGVALSLLAVS